MLKIVNVFAKKVHEILTYISHKIHDLNVRRNHREKAMALHLSKGRNRSHKAHPKPAHKKPAKKKASSANKKPSYEKTGHAAGTHHRAPAKKRR